MKTKKITRMVWMLPVCLVFWSACGSASEEKGLQVPEVVPVRLLPLEAGETQRAFTATGTFTTDDETLLSFKSGGVLAALNVEEGDPVKRGQILARLDPTEIQSGVAQVSLAYEKAARDFQRVQGLYKDSVATRQQMQNAQTARDVAAEQLKAARFNQRFSEIRATMDGYVLQRFVQPGQVVGPGTPVLMINGARSGDWMLKVGVSDQQWAAVKQGDKAVVHSALLPGGSKQAYVSHKPESVNPETGTFTLTLTLEDPLKGHIASGAFARVEIQPSKTQSGWRIPYGALLEGDEGQGYVFVTNDKKTARKVQVEIASIQADHINIASGLEDANYLIISGSAYLDAGSAIEVVSDQKK